MLPAPANDLLSSSAGERPVRIAPPALRALNLLLDELLFAWTHAAVTATLANSPQQQFNTSANGEAGQAAAAATLPNLAPLGPNEALTTDRFKFAVTRHAGSLGKEAVLESELAIREVRSCAAPTDTKSADTIATMHRSSARAHQVYEATVRFVEAHLQAPTLSTAPQQLCRPRRFSERCGSLSRPSQLSAPRTLATARLLHQLLTVAPFRSRHTS